MSILKFIKKLLQILVILNFTLSRLSVNIQHNSNCTHENNEVEPAEMNGSGKPVGGIEPLNISYCIIKFLFATCWFF